MEGTSQHAHTTRFARGTSSYRAPELVKTSKFTNKVDIWALGCILYEVLTLQKAFPSDNEVYDCFLKYSSTGEKVKLPLDLDEFQDERFEVAMGELIHKTLEIDSGMRPSALDLMWSLELAFGERSESTDSEPEAEDM
jgi:serine/threonine protein kinase